MPAIRWGNRILRSDNIRTLIPLTRDDQQMFAELSRAKMDVGVAEARREREARESIKNLRPVRMGTMNPGGTFT